jgi:hypothetical protein
MLTRSEFIQWFDDYKARFPAVGDYMGKQDLPMVLLDTWHQSIVAFDPDVLGAVTRSILDGQFEPVANVSLGTFGAEIRKLCRQVLDNRRNREHSQEWQRPSGSPYVPMIQGKMRDMLQAGLAVNRLLGDKAGDFRHTDDVHWDHPTAGSYCAAIILADDHTAYEEEQCLATLARDGLTWAQIQEAAGTLDNSPTGKETTHGQSEYTTTLPPTMGDLCTRSAEATRCEELDRAKVSRRAPRPDAPRPVRPRSVV